VLSGKLLIAECRIPAELQFLSPGNGAYAFDDLAPVFGELLLLSFRAPGIPIAVELPTEPKDGISEAVLYEIFGELFEVMIVFTRGALLQRDWF
jgi:hypothetical protein